MATAAAENDRREFFRVLALADLYLPQRLADAGAVPQRLMTLELFEHTFLPVYTSVETMAAQLGGAADGYSVTNYAELRRKWPDPTWRLAVNPGSPIDAYVPIEAVEAAAVGDLEIPTAAEVAVEEAENAPQIDVDGYVQALLDTVVLVPTAREVADPNEILEPGFPWRPVQGAEAPAIEVFTAEETFQQAYPEPVPRVAVAFPFVLSLWPEGHDLALDPRTPQALDLPADLVQGLLLWPPAGEEDSDDEGDER